MSKKQIHLLVFMELLFFFQLINFYYQYHNYLSFYYPFHTFFLSTLICNSSYYHSLTDFYHNESLDIMIQNDFYYILNIIIINALNFFIKLYFISTFLSFTYFQNLNTLKNPFYSIQLFQYNKEIYNI